jgi:hypothetical protein
MNGILGIKPNEIILLGHSLGSAPSVHLAITQAFRDVKAIILLSPIASGVRLVSPDIKINDLEKIDVFCNIKKIIDVCCPIFLIHGQKDEVIPIQQSLELSKYMKNPYEWHPRNGDHSNILTKYRTKFLQKCKFFFEFLNYYSKKQAINSSTATFHHGGNDKFYWDLLKGEKDENNPMLLVEDSYMGNNQFDQYDEINGHAFSSKDIYNRNDSFTNIQNAKINSPLVMRTNNPYNSQLKDYPFDMISDGPDFQNNKSGEQYENIEYGQYRDSRGSNVVTYNNNKDLEQQFNKMLIKHNGI